MLRLLFAILCAAAACMLVAGALSSAQTTATTPDAFITQVTGTTGNSHATDISANGRFVVFESVADAATLKPGETTKSPGNTDGNSEIFLYDYAQRRIFQLTNTRSVLNAAGSPTPSPSPSPSPSVSPSPTPSPTATPIDPRNVKIEITNRRPMISAEPVLSGGNRTYTIVFSSNAPDPKDFNGIDPGPVAGDGGRTLSTDANTEIWTYQFTVPDTVTLSEGADLPFQDLSPPTRIFTRVTSTPASRAPQPGSANTNCPLGVCAPVYADDNREAMISDAGDVIAFVSTRDHVPPGNADTGAIANPEIFLFNRGSGIFTQATSTITTNNAFPIFSANPNLAGSGGAFTLAFTSNANLAANNDDGGGVGNGEVYVATYNGAAIVGGSLRQVTKTKNNPATQQSAVVFTSGRRLSRDGRWVALESVAESPTANSGTNTSFLTSFVCDLLSNPTTCAQVGPRALTAPGDVTQFPGFTDYNGGTSPGIVVFTSALNFKSDGTFPTVEQDSTGLNPQRVSQLFATSLPLGTQPTGPFTRLTNIQGTNVLAALNSLLSNSHRRIAFTLGGSELGGGNGDLSAEVFYNLIPAVTTESTATISLFTDASRIPVASPSPTASPSGSPSPSPSPSPTGSPAAGPLVAPGLAAGELAFLTSSATLAPASAAPANISESQYSPPAPTELKGVSVSIRGAACPIWAVGPTFIKFVVPRGLPTGIYPIVISIQDSPAVNRVIRGNVAIVAAQPDIFTDPNVAGPGGRAMVCNATAEDNPNTLGACISQPSYNITSDNGSGTLVPTILRLSVTGVRGTVPSLAIVIVGTTSIVPNKITTADQPGFDFVYFTLPSTVDRGDLPIVLRAGTATSRPTPGDTPPRITINP